MNLASKITGSAFERIYNCPSSVSLGLNLPESEPEDYTLEGIRAHDLAAKILTGEFDLSEMEILAESELASCVRKYTNYIQDIRETLPSTHVFSIEQRLYLYPNTPEESPSGQLDCYLYDRKSQVAWIFDYKHGIGKPLNAATDYQLPFYAVLLRTKYPAIKIVHTVIIQPRILDVFGVDGVITTATLKYQTIDAWKRKIEETIKAVERGTTLSYGKWCQFCKARGRCPIYIGATQALEEEATENKLISISPKEITKNEIKRIAKLLLLKKKVKSWFESAEELLLGLAIQGQNIPGFELTPKRTNRKWNLMMSEQEIVEQLKTRGIEDPYKHELFSPAQAEKLCDIEGLWEKPIGGATLKALKE